MGNILYVITSLSVGGAQKALLNLASSEFSSEYRPFVISLVEVNGVQQQFEQAGIPVHVLGLNRLKQLPWLLPRLFGLVRTIKPSVIHGWMHHGNVLATLAWLFAGCRPVLLWGMHHTPEKATLERAQHAFILKLGRWLSRFPQRIVYVSRRSMQRHAELGYVTQHAQVIANGIPLGKNNHRAEQAAAVREELGIPPDAMLIGSLTRYVPEKDIPNLMQAIRLLQERGASAHFLLAGEGMDAGNPALQALLENIPDKTKVHLLGVRTDAARLIAALGIATLSSQREAFPLFLAEAMAEGVPCVATDVGDIAEFVADTGLIVPVNDSSALAEAWSTLLQQSVAQRHVLGKLAQQRVASRYSLDAVVTAYRQLLRGETYSVSSE
ncbi:glycosyltransferase [Thiothrix lacustris]|uniref:Glycosyltransferase n=1 Tax=Thiothrix lacustris TaxID=525917 RepID=A0ABY9MRP7_9GAMM|nr:glycosyltransferase [Thiothrix lacustris]WML91272.1 glycosyltransferase [Thiothrix lacustris]